MAVSNRRKAKKRSRKKRKAKEAAAAAAAAATKDSSTSTTAIEKRALAKPDGASAEEAAGQGRRRRQRKRARAAGVVDATAGGGDANRASSFRPGGAIIQHPYDLPGTDRLGEAAVHKYLVEQLGSNKVVWVNETTESGQPYDIVVTNGDVTEYVEVKTTVFPDKHWFHISIKEWQFASENGDSYTIAYVLMLEPDKANIVFLKNPHKMCQRKDLKLALVMAPVCREVVSEYLNEVSVVLVPGGKPANDELLVQTD
ncbi:hypothetical protein ACP70R_006733 [Stipagrostis hirtigluma subsp. patula]